MNPYQHIIDQWSVGNPAPFQLREHVNLFTGQAELVEQGSGEIAITKGAIISATIAERVAAHHSPDSTEPITVPVLVGMDEDGSPIVEMQERVPECPRTPFTYATPLLLPEHDNHCDMCGCESEIFQIGDGWYCKDIDPAYELTCYQERIKQLGGTP